MIGSRRCIAPRSGFSLLWGSTLQEYYMCSKALHQKLTVLVTDQLASTYRCSLERDNLIKVLLKAGVNRIKRSPFKLI